MFIRGGQRGLRVMCTALDGFLVELSREKKITGFGHGVLWNVLLSHIQGVDRRVGQVRPDVCFLGLVNM